MVDSVREQQCSYASLSWSEWPGIDGWVLICDVHGHPAWGEVYRSPLESPAGPCQWHDDPTLKETNVSENNGQSPVERVRDVLQHGQRFGNTSVVVRVDDLAAVLTAPALTADQIEQALLDATSSESVRGFVRVDNAVRAMTDLLSRPEEPRPEPTAEEEAAHEAEIDRQIAEHEERIAREDAE